MKLVWHEENPPRWDTSKAKIFGRTPPGIFGFDEHEDGEDIVGYGWMDRTWGDAEVLLVVDPEHQNRGVGTFIMDGLEREARARGVHYILNVLQPGHPEPGRTKRWLENRGFRSDAAGRLLRRVVHPSLKPS